VNVVLIVSRCYRTSFSVLLLDTNLATCTFTNIFMKMIKQCIPNYLVTIRTDDNPKYDNELRKHPRQRDKINSNHKR